PGAEAGAEISATARAEADGIAQEPAAVERRFERPDARGACPGTGTKTAGRKASARTGPENLSNKLADTVTGLISKTKMGRRRRVTAHFHFLCCLVKRLPAHSRLHLFPCSRFLSCYCPVHAVAGWLTDLDDQDQSKGSSGHYG